MPEQDPSGIGTDRAVIHDVEDDVATLHVGPGKVGLHVPVAELPANADVGTWVVLDIQSHPPIVLAVDDELTARRGGAADS